MNQSLLTNLQSRWQSYLSFGQDMRQYDSQTRRRIQFLNTLFAAGFVASLLAGLLIFTTTVTLSTWALWVGGTISISLLWLGYRLTRQVRLFSILFLIMMYLINSYLLVWYPFASGIYWLYLFLPVALILFSKRAYLLNVVFMLGVIIFLRVLTGEASLYAWREILSFCASYVVVSLFLLFYRSISDADEKNSYQTELELRKLTVQLTNEVAMKSSSQDQLRSLTEDLSKQNKQLTGSRLALVNLLEDARELETELADSKKHIEEKVIQRTEQLNVERARQAATLQSLPVGMILTDANLNIIDVNNTAYIILGIKDFSLSKLARPRVKRILKTQLNLLAALQETTTHQNQVSLPLIDFLDKTLQVTLAPVHAKEGSESIGVVIVLEDVTARRQLERSKDEFLMIASHELRTPLTAIRGNADLLEKVYGTKLKDQDFGELLGDITHSSIRLLDIVNDYLELSSLEQGKIGFQMKVVDLHAITRATLLEFTGLAKEKGLKLSLVSAKKPIYITSDPERLQQVISNLISNALHYTKQGSIKLSLTTERGKAVCRVADTGIGMSKASQRMLFGKFQQATDNPLTRDPTRSTGLGLYITQLLVKGLGGQIALESSRLRHGTVFLCSFPLATSRRRSSAPQSKRKA